jgi:sortase A
VLSSHAGSVTNSGIHSPRHRKTAPWWAVFAIVLGLLLCAWAFLFVKQWHPPQVAPVIPPKVTITPTPTPTETVSPSPEPTPTKPPSLYNFQPKVGDKLGTITLDSLKESWAIYEGTTETQLSKGVGHFVGSVLPGIEDRSVLSGHRTTVFNRLGELEKGDQIHVETAAGIFTYKVRSFWIVQRSNRDVIRSSPSGVQTLTTCYPFNSLVRTNRAFIVTADLVFSAPSIK